MAAIPSWPACRPNRTRTGFMRTISSVGGRLCGCWGSRRDSHCEGAGEYWWRGPEVVRCSERPELWDALTGLLALERFRAGSCQAGEPVPARRAPGP